MTLPLFDDNALAERTTEDLGPASRVLRAFALDKATELLREIERVATASPFRHMTTPGGHTMSVGMTSCGELGWVSDARGYRYARLDPRNGRPWPAMPERLLTLAKNAADTAGFSDFTPDTCLINRYLPGARMSLHQDKDERNRDAPIVSVSLGIPATFLFGGNQRSDPTRRVQLRHGDVVVWGGEDRLRFHGIQPLKPDDHRLVGPQRINLTFRCAG
ncbi:DNA oxidative demethylase AlkB [Lujinxingia sediminis]|uniref:DNA oxidative demethylase AlkB n=1 Tax=Lujinxingia sediminis TaxID=2480984 RepID=A0ABY0CXC6_9DELT|nr:DNA oxidative demethylase AlkB [Lujinxingia sediminis]RVU48548.1 DNA oxidative demethylase AlkB [Lujinxingia sediminis]